MERIARTHTFRNRYKPRATCLQGLDQLEKLEILEPDVRLSSHVEVQAGESGVGQGLPVGVRHT